MSAMSRSEQMARIRSQDTVPEMIVRRLIHALGFRYRLHRKDLPGRPDLVFPAKHKVVFVHGCFWHQHFCAAGRHPKTNRNYWDAKLMRNVERDRMNIVALRKLGWRSLIVWECQLRDLSRVEGRVIKFLKSP